MEVGMRSGQLERVKVRQWEGLSEGWPVRENTSKWIPQPWRREMLANWWSNWNSAPNQLVNLLISYKFGPLGLAS